MGEANEQAVLVHLDGIGLPNSVYEEYSAGDVEEKLIEAIEQAGTGEFDGIESGPEGVTLFMYGPDAEALYRSIEPVLQSQRLSAGVRIVVRPGGPEVPGREFRLPNY